MHVGVFKIKRSDWRNVLSHPNVTYNSRERVLKIVETPEMSDKIISTFDVFVAGDNVFIGYKTRSSIDVDILKNVLAGIAYDHYKNMLMLLRPSEVEIEIAMSRRSDENIDFVEEQMKRDISKHLTFIGWKLLDLTITRVSANHVRLKIFVVPLSSYPFFIKETTFRTSLPFWIPFTITMGVLTIFMSIVFVSIKEVNESVPWYAKNVIWVGVTFWIISAILNKAMSVISEFMPTRIFRRATRRLPGGLI